MRHKYYNDIKDGDSLSLGDWRGVEAEAEAELSASHGSTEQGLANATTSLESADSAPATAHSAQTPLSASPKARWNLYYH
ncbi:conserved hypothetical protein [Ricinus communis]|uniref:Uncharacterized protein n=1 Tax=Ricinus communis TaxID=3988 RepID=B9RHP9_RICCO|nr:conserved hypothetical protein [Ricinus communis]